MNDVEERKGENVKAVRNLDTIAGEINTIKQQARSYITNSCIEIGARLTEAKRLIGHGNWSKWLEESVDYSERTAQNLMKIYRAFGVEGNQGKLFGKELDAEQVKELNYTQMTALLKIRDDDERAEFMEEHREELKDMSTRELEAKIKELNEAKDKAEVEKAKAEETAAFLRKSAGEAERKARESIDRLETARNQAEAEGEFARQQAAKLRAELEEEKKKPVTTAVVKEVPEEVRQEMESMKKELEGLKARGVKDENETAFGYAFENVKREAQSMLRHADAMEPGKREKYRRAARKFFEVMADMAMADMEGGEK